MPLQSNLSRSRVLMIQHRVILAAAFLLAVFPAAASTHIWTGSASSQMSNAANWIGGSPASDTAAELSFPPDVVHLDVVNDIPNLTIKSLSFIGSQYSIS